MKPPNKETPGSINLILQIPKISWVFFPPDLVQQFLQAPRLSRQPRLHSWRLPNAAMHAAKIVIRKEKRQRRLMILPLFAVGIRQPRHAPNPHAQRQI